MQTRYKVVSHYSPRKGQIGEMIGRIANPSVNDIKLRFDDGHELWFNYDQVEPVT